MGWPDPVSTLVSMLSPLHCLKQTVSESHYTGLNELLKLLSEDALQYTVDHVILIPFIASY